MTGGSDPWSEWLHRHDAALVLFARQWVTTHGDAEDVVQDAFLRFWRSRDRVGEPTAYLYACVRNCAIDWCRQRSRQTQREQSVARTDREPMFQGLLEQDERRDAIETALRSLPENQREIVVMKVWGGLTFPQIAESLDISANTAASRYRYGLDKLRELMAEEPTR